MNWNQAARCQADDSQALDLALDDFNTPSDLPTGRRLREQLTRALAHVRIEERNK
jgi:hypothetical protein